jgi:predicted  nucleic acid-binding Zn-ribbon protein
MQEDMAARNKEVAALSGRAQAMRQELAKLQIEVADIRQQLSGQPPPELGV